MSYENKPLAGMLHACPVSRRQMLRGTAITAGAATLAAATLGASGARAQTKISQAQAGYQATPKDGHACNTCALFAAPASCNAVDGTISPSGWCKLYQKKA